MIRLFLALVLVAGPAAAQDRGQWFKSLKQPGTSISCCDLSDCRRTEAEWRGDGWQAIVNGSWTPIPAEKVLDRPKSIDGDAYVCAIGAVIYCFVPPLTIY